MSKETKPIQNETATRKTEQQITAISEDKQSDSKGKKETQQLVNRWKSYLAVPEQQSSPKLPVVNQSDSSNSYCTEDDEYYTTDSDDQQLLSQTTKESVQTRDTCNKQNPENIAKFSPERKSVKWDFNNLKLPESMNQHSLNQIFANKQASAKEKSKPAAPGQRNINQIQNPRNTQPIQSPGQSKFERIQSENQIAKPREVVKDKQHTYSQILNPYIKSEHANQTSIPQMQMQYDGQFLYPAYQSNVQEIPIQTSPSPFQNIPNMYPHQQFQRQPGNIYNQSQQGQLLLPKHQQTHDIRLNHPIQKRSPEMHQYKNQHSLSQHQQKQVHQQHDIPTIHEQFQKYKSQNWMSANQGVVPLTLEQMSVQQPCNYSEQQNHKETIQLYETQIQSDSVLSSDRHSNKISQPNNYQALQFKAEGVTSSELPSDHTFINKQKPNSVVAQQTHTNKQNEGSPNKQTESRKRKAPQSNIIKHELNFIAAPPVVLTPEYLMQKIESSPSTQKERQSSADETEKVQSSSGKITQFYSVPGKTEQTGSSLIVKAETVQLSMGEATHSSKASKIKSKEEPKFGVLCLEAGPTKKLKLLESRLNDANKENYPLHQKTPLADEQNNKQSKVGNRLKYDTKRSYVTDSESYKIALIYQKGYKKYLMQKYLDMEMQQKRIDRNSITRQEPMTGNCEQNNYNENTSLIITENKSDIPLNDKILNYLDTQQYFHQFGLSNVQRSTETILKLVGDAVEDQRLSFGNLMDLSTQLKSDHAWADNHLYQNQVSSAACEINNTRTGSREIVKTNSHYSLSLDNKKSPIQLNSEDTTSNHKTPIKHLKINSQKSQNIDNAKEKATIPSTNVNDKHHDKENNAKDYIAHVKAGLSDNSRQLPVQEAEFLYNLDLLNVTTDSYVGLNLPVIETDMAESSELPNHRSSYCTVHEILKELELPIIANYTNAVVPNINETEEQREMTENINVIKDHSDSFSDSSFGEIRVMLTDSELPQSFFINPLNDGF